MLRVGGRIKHAVIPVDEKHPLILPKNHHITTLLIQHHHAEVNHQGRLFTEGAIRAAGLLIVGCKRLIPSLINKCVTCRKLRRHPETQRMANNKRWAVIFTCLVIRAIHIEVVDDMSTSAFINALRRFIAITGKVSEIRSDCGSNFIGATSKSENDIVMLKMVQ